MASFLLTNDDGIDAPGLQALQKAIGGQGIIVAPLRHHSGCSHQVTTHRPMRIEQRSDYAYAVDGTPVDCIRIALSYLNLKPDFVLSGINAGGNLGSDIYISGTVAAVREAALHRLPGIAISHFIRNRRSIDWELATARAADVIDKLLPHSLEAGSFWNVNLPHPEPEDPEPALIFCPPCTQPLPAVYRLLDQGEVEYAGEYGQRSRDRGADVDICFSGDIAVTQVQLWGQTDR